MEHAKYPTNRTPRGPPWNKGKLIGAKPPLQPSHVWSIRTKLQMADRKRDLALFNLATANCAAVTSSPYVSMTWHRAAMPWTVRPYAKRRREGRCGLRSPTRPAWPLTTISG